jgi:hypothetical protein
MEQKTTTKKLSFFLPWILTFALLVAFTLFGYYRGTNPFERESIKVDLLSTMRIHLLEATEAEKNAVMAITDQTSEYYANQARQATAEVEQSRKEIEAIIHQENLSRESEILNEFNVCWSQFRQLDETILTLATQNTNLKAQKISTTEATQAMDHFEQSLNRLINTDNKCNGAVIHAYEALTAGLKIFVLHKPHIEEADDQAMDKIEQSIKAYDESAKKALDSLRGMTDLSNNEDLKNAQTAYEQFMNQTGEVLRLSRLNTNIKSAELSLGKKRLVSSQCQQILATLQEAVQEQRFNATR